MTYVRRMLIVGFGFLLCASMRGQSGASPSQTSADPAAESDWKAVTALTAPTTSDAATPDGQSTGGQKTGVEAEVDRLNAVAAAASEFGRAHGKSVHAADARKLEALSTIEAAQLGSTAAKAKAGVLAAAYDADKQNSDYDRFDVAFALEALQEPRSGSSESAREERIADALQQRFGESDRVSALYLSIARTSSHGDAARIARKLIDAKCPRWAKDQAQLLVDRDALVGSRVNLTLQTVDGRPLDTVLKPDLPTVLCVVDGSDALRQLNQIATLRRSTGAARNWVYVLVGTSFPTIDDLTRSVPVPGAVCFVGPDYRYPLLQQLKFTAAPYIYDFSAAGVLTDMGDGTSL